MNVPPLASDAAPIAESKPSGAKVKPLTDAELEQLLDARLDDPLRSMMAQHANQPFGQFANMFLAFSQMTIGRGVGLMSPSNDLVKKPILSPFPKSYRPKLKEFLDTVALQTFSEWKYDASSKYFQSDVPREELVANLAFFEFLPAKREHPFEITLAEGWKSEDKGAWIMYVPPSFIVGLDIWQMGHYSSDGDEGGAILDRIPKEVSLEWMRRLGIQDEPEMFSSASVGDYDALFFDKILDARNGKKLHWRQWVFMVDDECYAAVSTIFTDLDATIFPDVEKMLPTFRVKAKSAQP